MSERAWHFVDPDRRLRHGDEREVRVGETLTVDGPVRLCERGLHASRRAWDALRYVCDDGLVACLVDLGGEVVEDGDKLAGTSRTCVAMVDADLVLREVARRAALRVAHLWDCPPVVRAWLEGDDSARGAAWCSAESAIGLNESWKAAQTAATSAAESAHESAWKAARGAIWCAAWCAARSAVGDAPWRAARSAAEAAESAARKAAESAAWSAAQSVAAADLERLLLAAIEVGAEAAIRASRSLPDDAGADDVASAVKGDYVR